MSRKFIKISKLLKSPHLIKKKDLINFLCDVKETGKIDKLLQLSHKEIMKLDKNELIIEFDNLRNRLHQNSEILFTLFPSLKSKWDNGRIIYAEINRKEKPKFKIL